MNQEVLTRGNRDTNDEMKRETEKMTGREGKGDTEVGPS